MADKHEECKAQSTEDSKIPFGAPLGMLGMISQEGEFQNAEDSSTNLQRARIRALQDLAEGDTGGF